MSTLAREPDPCPLTDRWSLPLAARRHALVREAGHRLDRFCGVPAESHLIIGCSGGADSMALLLAALALSKRTRRVAFRVRPIVVHVHHHLRPTADGDAQFVEALCRRAEVPFRVEHVHPRGMAGNLAAAARALRYGALVKVAQETGTRWVATAHHAEDQFETMVMALCRGAGPSGLAGMSWSRPLSEGIELVRPLLATARRECESICRAAGIQWREDPSNADLTRPRTRLRHEVMPLLQELWPNAAHAAVTTCDLLRIGAAALETRVGATFGPPECRVWDRALLRASTPPVIVAGLHRAVRDELGRNTDRIGRQHFWPAAEAVADDDPRPRRFRWPEGFRLEVTARRVKLDAERRE